MVKLLGYDYKIKYKLRVANEVVDSLWWQQIIEEEEQKQTNLPLILNEGIVFRIKSQVSDLLTDLRLET